MHCTVFWLFFGSLAQFAEVNNHANIRHQIAVPSSLISSRSFRRNLATIVMPDLETNPESRRRFSNGFVACLCHISGHALVTNYSIYKLLRFWLLINRLINFIKNLK